MFMEFEIQRCTRRCSMTNKELLPGESFFSTLHTVGADVVRKDFSVGAWAGPPDDALGWWKSQVPDANSKKPQLAPNDVILSYFSELEARADKADLRYVLALLMIRRRILRLEETECDANGEEKLVLYCSRNETEYKAQVRIPGTSERILEIQRELSQLLFADAV